jgi:hypothetical protein
MGSSNSSSKINIKDPYIVLTYKCGTKTTNTTQYHCNGVLRFDQKGFLGNMMNLSNPCGTIWHDINDGEFGRNIQIYHC